MSSTMQTFYLLGIITALLFHVHGYTYSGRIDTSSGYCEGEGYKVPVGEVGYNSEACEKIICGHNYLEVLGCGYTMVPQGCDLYSPEGDYPACCPMPKCPEDN